MAQPLLVIDQMRFLHGTCCNLMPYKKEEDDDLFEDDFEFVDEEDSDVEDEEDSDIEEKSDLEDAKPAKKGRPKGRKQTAPKAEKAPRKRAKKSEAVAEETPVEAEVDEAVEEEVAEVPAGPPADHVVHVYEFRKFKRTIQRDFTSDEADGFAKEYNRTSSNHSRWAVSSNKDSKPTPTI
ncbi:hypothetical protein Pla144_08420 [Bythopirellula polymerisocia]|uniref:Uncharacterized protein n=2 Tax=Bythopirellula polymerisocia TaxID=2528003 RepID=A0A5C6D478_9BACT|nr:hypothetical protein Pla144_08420 [Bythopirellula polymerisocia]